MQKTTATIFALFVGIAATGLFDGPARAATLLVDDTGQLTGARNVDVNGALFDVTFVTGTCADVFTGCDESSDFDLDEATAQAAAQALLDQVFIDTGLGLFDTDPALTSGCSAPFACEALIPYAVVVSQGASLLAFFAENADPSDTDGTAQLIAVEPFADRPLFDDQVWAIFASSSEVPEPSTLLLLGIGLAGMTALGRRRRLG